jgi:hypothetical protein
LTSGGQLIRPTYYHYVTADTQPPDDSKLIFNDGMENGVRIGQFHCTLRVIRLDNVDPL